MAINYVDNTKRFLVGQLKRPGLYLGIGLVLF
jgi:hypothetical protein